MHLYVDDFDRLSNVKDESLKEIFSHPRGHWFTKPNKKLKESVQRFIARTGDAVPVCVLYFIPNRDLGSFSKGGAKSARRYLEFVTQFAEGLGDKDALVIFEPDALAHAIMHSGDLLDQRIRLINEALTIIANCCRNALVYLDVGHPRWISHFVISKTLKKVYNFHGISINVSNFVPTEECIRYGMSIGKPFVIDTSRNGAEYSDNGWCNPPNKRLGELPKIVKGHLLLEAFLWIKVPGESDGKENGGPKAGVFWPSYAKELLNDKKTRD